MKKDYPFGIFLIFVGLLFVLLNFHVITMEWLLLILSVGTLIVYLMKRSVEYLVFGIMLLGISLVLILDNYVFVGIDVENFIFLTILGITSLIIYGKEKNKPLLIIGTISISFGLYNLISEIAMKDVRWLLYLLFGISFYIIYLIGYRNSDSNWPKYVGSSMIIISLLFFLSSQAMLNIKLWRFIFYVLPVLLIAVGIKIIYDRIKIKA
jgi:hypothetical protein